MDRDTIVRTVAAIAISLVIMIAWNFFFGPSPEERAEAARRASEDRQAAATQTPEPPGGDEPRDSSPVVPEEEIPGQESARDPAPLEFEARVSEALVGDEGQDNIDIVNGSREITFSPLGARLVAYRLLRHEQDPGSPSSRPVDLVSPVARAIDHDPLFITTGDPVIDEAIAKAWFVVDRDPPTEEELRALRLPRNTERVVFRWADGEGLEVEKAIYLPHGGSAGDDGAREFLDADYLMKVRWDVRKDGKPIENAMISWGPGISRLSDGNKGNRYAYYGRVVAALPNEILRYDPSDDMPYVVWPSGLGPRWLALDTQFFSVAMIVDPNRSSAVRAFETSHLGAEAESQRLAIETSSRVVTFFGGPKDDKLLEDVARVTGTDLTKLVDWGFFGFLAKPMYIALAWIHSYVGNWGWAIVIITIIIKIIFFPLTQKSMVSMRRTQQNMAKLQPKIRYIKEKYREKRDMDSRKAMNQEMMELYNKEGVNPMSSLSGCMPLLLQLPILWGMYNVLSIATPLRGAPFVLWIEDLSVADPYYATPLVMGATMLLQQIMAMTKTEDPQQKSQQRMMLMMPVMFTWFFLNLPSGLVLYWLTNNVLGIGQQVLINRTAAKQGLASTGKTTKPAKKKSK